MSGEVRRSPRIRKHSLPNHQINFKEISNSTPSISVDGSNIVESGEFEKFGNQVAGHQFAEGKQSVGILKCKDGTILKAFSNPVDGLRELQFYEQLSETKDPILLQFKEFTCDFYGTRKVMVNDKQTEFIILQDLTEGFTEPCIIDIKIGERTWDPLASPKKDEKENKKYKKTKQSLGICIPGFHVYDLSSGKIQRYDKNYGKQLNEQSIYNAFKIFLNANEDEINNELLSEILTQLRKIQKWAKMQNIVRLYSTSILIVYDAEVLRAKNKKKSSKEKLKPDARKPSFKSTEEDLILSNGIVSPKDSRKTQRSQSFQSYLKQDYISNNLDAAKPWCIVKIIDLGHVFPPDEEELDFNYLNGINSLVEIFEKFLSLST